MTLEITYNLLLSQYISDPDKIKDYWSEIEHRHTEKHRYYHTLNHLDELLRELEFIKDKFENFEAVLFALFYHDIVYDVPSSKNEEDSARIANERLNQIGVDSETKELCYEMIIATKTHAKSYKNDINLFTDADLSILGKARDIYEQYYVNVRKEFSVYPKFMYKRGRVKVLKSFLEKERLFNTEYFQQRYGATTKMNILREIEFLRQNR